MKNIQQQIASVLVFAVGVNLFLIALNNVLDFNSNWQFVRHVLMMDTTFPDNNLLWRSIHSEPVQMIFYVMIIAAEAVVAVLCFMGAYGIWKGGSARAAYYGLTLSILIWFGAFITIGGEWFLMWQSETWNGMDSALRYFIVSFFVLIYLTITDRKDYS